MAVRVEIEGLDKVLANLNKEIASISGDVQKGLTLGALRIKADSMKMTPVDVGNLRGSHYVVVGSGGGDDTKGNFRPPKGGKKASPAKMQSYNRVVNEHQSHIQEAKAKAGALRAVGVSASSGSLVDKVPFAEIGCTAFYALYVHEALEAKHTVGEAKFLQKAIIANVDKLLNLIRRYAKR